MPTTTQLPRPARRRTTSLSRLDLWSTLLVCSGVLIAAAYGLLAGHPYRGIAPDTALATRAQDVVSLVVAVLLAALLHPRARTPRGHVLRLGLLGYVAYSYAIYLVGLVMNQVFLVYVVIVCVATSALIDGIVRMRPFGWGTPSPRLAHRTGWFLVATTVVFAGIWLISLAPTALTGEPPPIEGPGGVPYPVFVLDLCVALPCIFAVGWLLLHAHPVAVPLAAVALIKVVTLFTALWSGVAAVYLVRGEVSFGPDAVPSAVLLVASLVLLLRWLAVVPDTGAPPLNREIWRSHD